jgi:hypothetical protein
LENKRAEQVLCGSGRGWRYGDWGRRRPKQCIHMSVNVKMIKFKKMLYINKKI